MIETVPGAPYRAARVWQPSVRTRSGQGGVLYVEQEGSLPAYPHRIT